MSSEHRALPGFLPPLIFIACLLPAGIAEILYPRSLLPATLGGVWFPLGIALFVAGGTLGSLARMALKEAEPPQGGRNRAATISGSASRLATGGIYRFSRNPSYLGTTLILAGVAVAFNSLWTLMGAAAFTLLIWAFAIRAEERALSDQFGRVYESYRQRVPRWLGPF